MAHGAPAALGVTVTTEQFTEIVDYAFLHQAPMFHAIARVIGTKCRCFDCWRGASVGAS